MIITNTATPPTDDDHGEHYGLRLVEIQALAGEDWHEIENDPEQIAAFAHACVTRHMRESGQVPPHYTQVSNCPFCGPVWMWPGAPEQLISCPWCLVRVTGVTFPQPNEVTKP